MGKIFSIHSAIAIFLGNKHTHFTCMYLICDFRKGMCVHKKEGKFEALIHTWRDNTDTSFDILLIFR